MTKKVLNFTTTVILILVAICSIISFVGCGTKTRRDTGLAIAKDLNSIELANKYRQPVKVEVYENKYYVSYARDIEHTSIDGEEDYIKIYYVDVYDNNKKMVDFNMGYSYEQAITPFAEAKP